MPASPISHHCYFFGLRNFCFVKKLFLGWIEQYSILLVAFWQSRKGMAKSSLPTWIWKFFSRLYTWIWWMGGSCTPVVSPFHHFASQGSLTKLCTPAFWFRVRSRKCSCQINRLLVTDSLSLTKVINPGPFTMGREHFPLPARLLLQGRISQEAS